MLRTARSPSLHRLAAHVAGLALSLTPALAVAEVSDKMPTPTHVWIITLVASGVCGALTAWRPWLGASVAAGPAFWMTGLLMEMHSPDIAPHLLAGQSWSYYLKAYVAVGVFVVSLALGLHQGQRWRKT